MKKFWKIFGITLGSLVSVVLVAVFIAIYVVFTPARLTPIVRSVVDEYVSCPHEVGEVDLTFFSTFPEFGLRLKGLYIINPMDSAQSDTLLAAPEVVAKVDVMRFLKENALDVHELTLNDVTANIFFNSNGESNLDVFVFPEDTTDDTDTSAFSLPFDVLKIEKIRIHTNTLTYVDCKSDINAALFNTTLTASADGFDDIDLNLKSKDVSATISGEQYAEHLSVSVSAPNTAVTLDTLSVTLRKAQLAVNEFSLQLDGMASMPEDDIVLNMQLKAVKWDIPALLTLLPQSIGDMLTGIDIDAATASLTADIAGVYNDNTMPLVDATLQLQNAKVAYKEVFPYSIEDILLDATAHIDLNQEPLSSMKINGLHARTGKTTIDATGIITDLLGDLLADLNANLKVNLPEFKQYLESDGITTDLHGTASGKAHAKIRLSDLTEMRLHKGDISANLDLTNLNVQYDSILLSAPKMNVVLQIPNKQPSKKSVNWISATLKPTALNVEMIDFLKADLGSTTFSIQASNVLSDDPLLCADVALQTEHLTAEMDSMGCALQQPKLTAYIEYDTKDTIAIPKVDATIAFADLQGYFDDIKAHLTKSDITASLSGSRKDKTQPRATIKLNTNSVKANMGEDVKAQTGRLSLTANARRNPKYDDMLLQWNPRLSFDLNDGVANLTAFPEEIQIPHIKFDYSNKDFHIADSRIVIGNSDFSLTGEVRNIGKWLEKKGNLEGELAFTSDHTDVNELMALTSADSGTEETKAEAETSAEKNKSEEANPFLVPKDVNLTLTTNIKEAVVFDQLARNLGGRLYVQNGVLILEEMGFICNAAKLQLTAMYKTPRRDDLFVGLDYHMLDIDIQELVNMIPQIDTMMPMLRSFRGNAEFHIAAETFLFANYDIKPSTIRAAMSIEGKDLVLLDGETFSQIAKILLFNKKTENRVDSISAQLTMYKDEIDIYPFCMTMDKYMAAVGGHHYLDMSFDYHISLLSPLYIGVDVKGTFDDLKIKPAKCRYAQDFRPIIHKDVETQNASLKKMISEALKRNVKIE